MFKSCHKTNKIELKLSSSSFFGKCFIFIIKVGNFVYRQMGRMFYWNKFNRVEFRRFIKKKLRFTYFFLFMQPKTSAPIKTPNVPSPLSRLIPILLPRHFKRAPSTLLTLLGMSQSRPVPPWSTLFPSHYVPRTTTTLCKL